MAALPYKKIDNHVAREVNRYSYTFLAHLKIIPGINLFSEPVRTDYKVLQSCITIKAYSVAGVTTVYHNGTYCNNDNIIWRADYFDILLMRLFLHIPITKIGGETLNKNFYDKRFGGKRDFRSILFYYCSHDVDLKKTSTRALATAVAIESKFIKNNLEMYIKPTYIAKWDCLKNKWDWGTFYTFNGLEEDESWRRFKNDEIL
jgi:hypothetical protein